MDNNGIGFERVTKGITMNFTKSARTVALLIFGLGLSFTTSAATIRVPQDKLTITAGVAAANNGDTIAVSPGTYNEINIQITKNLTVTSLTGATDTIIDNQHTGRGFIVTGATLTNVNIVGLTIQNAQIPYYQNGGAIHVVSGKCKISGCIIQGTSGAGDYGSSPIANEPGWNSAKDVDNVVVEDTIVRNNFAANGAGIGFAAVIRCAIYGNTGGNNCIALVGCNATNCTVYGNNGGYIGGGQGGNWDSCIVWNNSPPQLNAPLSVNCCIVQGGFAGTGNLASDPLFVNAANGDFHLLPASPAIDAGNPAPVFNDPDGSRADIGAYPYSHSLSFLTGGLAAYYPFDGNANDASGNGVNGTVHGAVLTADRFGNPNGAYYFDGSSAYITAPLNNAVFSNDFTASVWFNANDYANGWPTLLHGMYVQPGNIWIDAFFLDIIGQRSGAGAPNIIGDVTAMSTYASGGISWHMVRGQRIPLNTYNQVIVTKAGTTTRMYWNGQIATTSQVAHASPALGQYITIGRADAAYYSGDWAFHGVIDDVRIYNRALSDSEVAQLYAYEGSPHPQVPHRATATAQVVNGFVVGITITDPGYAYTNNPPPVVRFRDASGTGATAHAIVRLANDEGLRRRFGAVARERTRAHELDQVIDAWLQILHPA